jgi:hypothetical protein
MAWESVTQTEVLNREHYRIWREQQKEMCPVCELRVTRSPGGKRGCTFCGWTEVSGVVLQ